MTGDAVTLQRRLRAYLAIVALGALGALLVAAGQTA
jgi:hypothetical protein